MIPINFPFKMYKQQPFCHNIPKEYCDIIKNLTNFPQTTVYDSSVFVKVNIIYIAISIKPLATSGHITPNICSAQQDLKMPWRGPSQSSISTSKALRHFLWLPKSK